VAERDPNDGLSPPRPNFLIIGAAKAGTTSLHRYLAAHPEVYMSSLKETNYFAYVGPAESGAGVRVTEDQRRFPIRTREEYLSLFRDVTTEKAVGESSPLYLETPTAPSRIRRAIPDARIVVSLRDPADRAVSGYMMRVRSGRQAGGIVEALSDPTGHLIQLGYYFNQLKRYYDLFPRERIHVCLFDDLKADPNLVLRGIFRFLRVDQDFKPDLSRQHNPGGVPKNWLLHRLIWGVAESAKLRRIVPPWVHRTGRFLHERNLRRVPVPPELLVRLRELYAEDVLRVQGLIERDLSAWLPDSEASVGQ
jgi:hypothetical protein